MTLELPLAIEQELQHLAAQTDRSPQELAREAVEGFVAYRKSIVGAVEEGRAAAARGDMVDHDEVMAMMDEIIAHG